MIVDKIRIPFITPDTAEATKAATIIAETTVHTKGPPITVSSPNKEETPPVTKNTAEPIEAAIPQTRAKRQIISTAGAAFFVQAGLIAGYKSEPIE